MVEYFLTRVVTSYIVEMVAAAGAGRRRAHGRCARSAASLDGGEGRCRPPGPAPDRLLQPQVGDRNRATSEFGVVVLTFWQPWQI